MSEENIKKDEEKMEEEVLPQEEQVEEKPVEETLPQEEPVEEKPYDVLIEEARKDLYKQYSTSRKISNILMLVIVVAIVGVMFLIMSNNNILKIVGYVVGGLLVVGMIVYYVLNRNRFPNKVKNYVALVSTKVNERTFQDASFSEMKFNNEEKIALDDLIADGIYQEASGINSRNVAHGKFNERSFLYGEAALLRPSSRKQQVPPLFVGKYVSITNDLKFDGRIILNFKNPKEPLDLPNAVSDLVILEEKEDFVVYGNEGLDYHKLLKNDIIFGLRKIEIKDHLLNVNVVFWSGHTAAYLSYDDAIMSVPFDKPFDKNGFEQSFNDLLNCLKVIAEK